MTVTVKLHWPVLPRGSVAVQVTVVLPSGKVEPEGGLQATITVYGPLALWSISSCAPRTPAAVGTNVTSSVSLLPAPIDAVLPPPENWAWKSPGLLPPRCRPLIVRVSDPVLLIVTCRSTGEPTGDEPKLMALALTLKAGPAAK